MTPHERDPLWRMRHGLAGLGLALALSVPLAAWLGATLGDLIAPSYGARVAVYGLLLVHVIVGAIVLFVRVAQHETRRVSAGRVALWLVSLWLWPALLATGRRRDG